jgi:hypothetical protein
MHVRQLPDLPMELPEDPSEVGILAAQPADQKARHVVIDQLGKLWKSTRAACYSVRAAA